MRLEHPSKLQTNGIIVVLSVTDKCAKDARSASGEITLKIGWHATVRFMLR
jgi:hypothetical protein